MTDEDTERAKAVLEKAITEYFKAVGVNTFIDDWALVTHHQSVELSADNMTRIHVLAPTDTPAYRISGLLHGAL